MVLEIVLNHLLIKKNVFLVQISNKIFPSSFLASGDFCHLLITSFANSLDQDQDRQNVGPDLDANCLTL